LTTKKGLYAHFVSKLDFKVKFFTKNAQKAHLIWFHDGRLPGEPQHKLVHSILLVLGQVPAKTFTCFLRI
jgi:hypothetical protein